MPELSLKSHHYAGVALAWHPCRRWALVLLTKRLDASLLLHAVSLSRYVLNRCETFPTLPFLW